MVLNLRSTTRVSSICHWKDLMFREYPGDPFSLFFAQGGRIDVVWRKPESKENEITFLFSPSN